MVLRRTFERAWRMAVAGGVLACAGCVYAPPGYYYPYSYYSPPAPSATVPAPPAAAQAAPAETCHEYQQTVTIDGKPVTAYGTACRQADGSWRPMPAQ